MDRMAGCYSFNFQVVLSRQNNPVNYLFGVVSIILTLIVMFNAKLYAEFTLNLYYLVMSIYGWLYWKYGKAKHEAPISYTDNTDKLKTAGIVVLALVFLFCSYPLYQFGCTHMGCECKCICMGWYVADG